MHSKNEREREALNATVGGAVGERREAVGERREAVGEWREAVGPSAACNEVMREPGGRRRSERCMAAVRRPPMLPRRSTTYPSTRPTALASNSSTTLTT